LIETGGRHRKIDHGDLAGGSGAEFGHKHGTLLFLDKIPVVLDPDAERVGQLLAPGGIGHAFAVAGFAEKSALDEDRWNFRVTEDGEPSIE